MLKVDALYGDIMNSLVEIPKDPVTFPMETTDAHQATLFHQFDLFSGGQKTGG
jgi:hypothetical protein